MEKSRRITHKMSKLSKGLFLIVGIVSVLFLFTRNSILEPIVFFLVAILALTLVIEKIRKKEFFLTGLYILILLFDLYVFFQTITF